MVKTPIGGMALDAAAGDDADASALLQARLVEVSETARGSIIANVANFLCVAIVARTYGVASWAAVAGATCVLLAALGWRLWAAMHVPRDDAEEADHQRLRQIHWHVTASATLLGLFWGAIALYLLKDRTADTVLFAGIIGTGMMSAGAITYRSVPHAALGWVAGSGLLSGIGLWLHGAAASWIALGLLLCFVLVLRETILTNGRRFGRAFLQARELARSSETIRLLLNDYTEQGSDWLIEVDAAGRIVNPCARLAEATGRSGTILAGVPFGRLLDDNDGRSEMKDHFRAGRAFRRQIVSLTVDGETRWWSVSARPVDERRIAYRGVVTDITAQRQAEERVSYLAHFDGLTDLPNRFLFNERLYRMLSRGSRAAGVMYIDLDNFKSINDTLGHPVGDKLLQAVARRLEAIVGKGLLVARLGGDEFAVLVPPRRLASMDRLAATILADLVKPLSLGDHDVMVGASIGMAVAPQDADCRETLMRMADLALYAAKAAGRGVARRFDPAMDVAAQARRQIELDLRTAQAEGQLRLHYQPLVDGATGELTGCEALIRWVHPERGVVMPDSFIGVAEETGLIIPIGEWAIRKALDDARHWPGHIEIAINLSPLQMRSPTLVSTILNALAASQVAPNRLCLEITESVLMQDSAVNVETLHKLRSFGIRIALDDFGTGYSSLSYLRSFPFDKIKIDRCFVDDVDHHAQSRAIIGSVVDLAATLGMQTVAEGVERESQADALRLSGCQHLQGFLYSRAVPADELTDLRPPGKRKAA
jgi:diguanylate cyclase (GGDEF)-like protein/PAS domain S-box-containing protein